MIVGRFLCNLHVVGVAFFHTGSGHPDKDGLPEGRDIGRPTITHACTKSPGKLLDNLTQAAFKRHPSFDSDRKSVV